LGALGEEERKTEGGKGIHFPGKSRTAKKNVESNAVTRGRGGVWKVFVGGESRDGGGTGN